MRTAIRWRPGTGLGLAIVKHIVARHRGRLLVESTPGEGASFSVRLPYMAERHKRCLINL
jgi:two-component system phosphate regulon sensor histidine kinase PhoR